MPISPGVEPLARIGASAQVAAAGASARVALPAGDGIRGYRFEATAPLRFALGDGTVTAADAAGTSVYMGSGAVIEARRDNATHVAAIGVGGSGVLHVVALLY